MIIQLNRLQSLKIESLNLTTTLCDLDSQLPLRLSLFFTISLTYKTLMLTSNI